jgi:hypothetical protein
MNKQHKIATATFLSLFLSNAALAQCDVQLMDSKATPVKVQEVFAKLSNGNDKSTFVNSVDIDGDGIRDFVLIKTDNASCVDHGCVFIGIKETKDGM